MAVNRKRWCRCDVVG